MQYNKRNPVSVLLLSIVTCGIYSLYLIYQISKEVRDFRGDSSIDPGLELLLCIITCGLYEIYWYYKYGRLVFDMEQRVGVSGASDMSLILLLLPIFGFGIVSLLLLQTELNRVWDTINPTSGPTDGTQGT
ncbi:MAG: DUF4234 domain-containing protein [Eubacteriales bacterium]